MSQPFHIEVDSKALMKEFNRIERGLREKVIQQSVNRSLTHVRTTANRMVRERIALPAKDVNKALSVNRAYRRTAVASMDVHPKPVPLIKYKARQTKRGVTVKVKKQGSRKRITYAFLTTMASGHKGVFARDLKKERRRGPPPQRADLPIKELHGPEVIQVLNDPQVLEELVKKGQAHLVNELRRRFEVISR